MAAGFQRERGITLPAKGVPLSGSTNCRSGFSIARYFEKSPPCIDNVGTDAMNQKLSENRAASVRDYLVQQGVPTNSVSAKGFGNTLPVASNDNPAGRQQNRRVELVVSGEAIGSPVNATTGSLR